MSGITSSGCLPVYLWTPPSLLLCVRALAALGSCQRPAPLVLSPAVRSCCFPGFALHPFQSILSHQPCNHFCPVPAIAHSSPCSPFCHPSHESIVLHPMTCFPVSRTSSSASLACPCWVGLARPSSRSLPPRLRARPFPSLLAHPLLAVIPFSKRRRFTRPSSHHPSALAGLTLFNSLLIMKTMPLTMARHVVASPF